MKPDKALTTVPALAAIAELAAIAREVDGIHAQSVECRKSLRAFLASALSYMPGWMRWLYRVRWVFVRLLGARQDGVPAPVVLAAENVPFAKGEEASIFTVVEAKEGSCWLGKATDKMVAGYFGVIAQPLENGLNRFHVVTMVQYRHWTGRVYFTIINPFHHLVVACMVREAAKDAGVALENAAFGSGQQA
jgi:hypothetical protein